MCVALLHRLACTQAFLHRSPKLNQEGEDSSYGHLGLGKQVVHLYQLYSSCCRALKQQCGAAHSEQFGLQAGALAVTPQTLAKQIPRPYAKAKTAQAGLTASAGWLSSKHSIQLCRLALLQCIVVIKVLLQILLARFAKACVCF